jgi:lipopolysaccharide transport system ATP-binding protein
MSASDTVIEVDAISKLYRLGEVSTGTLAHDLNRWWHKARGKPDPYLKLGQANDRTKQGSSDYVYAVQDVSFKVDHGEVLGIVGRNGAGKSTLLKILSRVTTPTSGRVRVKGRIASLLEVGTGFHPELTGRENIYLNGAILGMRRDEITRHLDAIIEFSGCDRYIDTPVKRYSSGMYVRLAFAVAAHLEPEILIVDEVLAVGDLAFQKKCLGRMSEVAAAGRTVLFVSHNLEAVRKLCTRAVLLEQGRLAVDGPVDRAIATYIDSAAEWDTVFAIAPPAEPHPIAFSSQLTVEDLEGRPMNGFVMGKPWQVRVHFTVTRDTEHLIIALGLVNARGVALWTSWSKPMRLRPGFYSATFKNEEICLSAGSYTLAVGISDHETAVHYVDEAGTLGVAELSEGTDALRIGPESGIIKNAMAISIADCTERAAAHAPNAPVTS